MSDDKGEPKNSPFRRGNVRWALLPRDWDWRTMKGEAMDDRMVLEMGGPIVVTKLTIEISAPNMISKPVVDRILYLLRAFRVKFQNVEVVNCKYFLQEK